MEADPRPALSVCVATRNRATALLHFLHSLQRAEGAAPGLAEIIIVDNGSTDDTGRLLQEWAAAAPRRTQLVEPEKGKSRAINRALSMARAALLAFTDDDVEVASDWFVALVEFFRAHPEFDAAMGRVVLPPTTDAAVRDLVARYRTIPVFDEGDSVCELTEMYGCNMAVRRTVFDRIGTFNEALGPGTAGGSSEDLDLSRRILAAGLRIGYMPTAVVTHEVDRSRLTREYLREFQVRLGRGELTMSPGSYWRHALRLVESVATLTWSSVRGDERRRVHAWGRMVRHADALRWGWQEMRRRVREDV